MKDECQIKHYTSDPMGDDYPSPDEPPAVVGAKVSSDGGETWTMRDVNLGGDIEDSGLAEGDIFQLGGNRYVVVMGDFGLTIEFNN